MGNQHLHRLSEHFRKQPEKKPSENNSNEPGEDFYLEDWEICNDKNKNIDSSVKIDSDLLISQVEKDPFKDYEIKKTLGEGAFGQVHLVTHKITGATRAMKVIEKKDTFTENNEQEVLNELNVLKKMDHPNIIKVFEFYMDDDNYYMITEYCSDGDLFDFVKDSKLNEIQSAYIMFQLFSALNYCHKMKIIHRDLKPENIFISKKEINGFIRIKVGDFGASQIFKKGDFQKEVVGSVYYIAPEVILKNYNFKCDLWSCGIILYILLTHKMPFFADNDEDILKKILSSEYDTNKLSKFSDNTKDLISKLLEREVNKRITAEEALEHKYFEEFKVKDLLNDFKDKKKIEKFVENLKNYKRKSILQETILAYLIHNFPDLEDITESSKLFDKIDVKGKGKISLDDLYIGLSLILESDKLKDDIVEIFANLDTDKNNYLGYEDFARGAIDKGCLLDEKVLKFAFNYFDKENNGVITIKEISSIFKDHIKTKDIDETLNKIIEEVDEDGDGKITYEKFCKIMKNIII